MPDIQPRSTVDATKNAPPRSSPGERRLEAERLAFFDHIRKLQTNHEAVHVSYLKQRDQLKEQLITAQGEVSSLTKEIWWWRVGLVAVLSIGALTTAALLTP